MNVKRDIRLSLTINDREVPVQGEDAFAADRAGTVRRETVKEGNDDHV